MASATELREAGDLRRRSTCHVRMSSVQRLWLPGAGHAAPARATLLFAASSGTEPTRVQKRHDDWRARHRSRSTVYTLSPYTSTIIVNNDRRQLLPRSLLRHNPLALAVLLARRRGRTAPPRERKAWQDMRLHASPNNRARRLRGQEAG